MSTSASGSRTLHRWSAPACLVAGVLWLLVWSHQRTAHGRTTANEMRLVLGFTWMDSGKLLVVPLGLFFVAIVGLYWSMSQPGLPGRIGFAVSAGSLLAVIAGTALQFWGFEWGSYEEQLPYSLPEGSIPLTAAPARLAALSTTKVIPLDALRWVAAGALMIVIAGLLQFLGMRAEAIEKLGASNTATT